MAARKKKPETMSLFGAAPAPPAVAPPPAEDVPEAPKLRLVPKVETPDEDVIVEPTGDGRFIVSVLSHHGTTSRAVTYSRKQLEMLLRRIPSALEVG